MKYTNSLRQSLIGLIVVVFTFAYIPFENFVVYANGNQVQETVKDEAETESMKIMNSTN